MGGTRNGEPYLTAMVPDGVDPPSGRAAQPLGQVYCPYCKQSFSGDTDRRYSFGSTVTCGRCNKRCGVVIMPREGYRSARPKLVRVRSCCGAFDVADTTTFDTRPCDDCFQALERLRRAEAVVNLAKATGIVVTLDQALAALH